MIKYICNLCRAGAELLSRTTQHKGLADAVGNRLIPQILYMMGVLSPVMMLVLRVWIGHVFWVSGVLKASDWDTTITLFTYEHPVPFLPVSLAAFMGTAFELLALSFLCLGWQRA
jgi:hypothetical protein